VSSESLRHDCHPWSWDTARGAEGCGRSTRSEAVDAPLLDLHPQPPTGSQLAADLAEYTPIGMARLVRSLLACAALASIARAADVPCTLSDASGFYDLRGLQRTGEGLIRCDEALS
jgi:hypothetical protein